MIVKHVIPLLEISILHAQVAQMHVPIHIFLSPYSLLVLYDLLEADFFVISLALGIFLKHRHLMVISGDIVKLLLLVELIPDPLILSRDHIDSVILLPLVLVSNLSPLICMLVAEFHIAVILTAHFVFDLLAVLRLVDQFSFLDFALLGHLHIVELLHLLLA